jgi:hydroxyacid-oxoacid transhydrogenase
MNRGLPIIYQRTVNAIINNPELKYKVIQPKHRLLTTIAGVDENLYDYAFEMAASNVRYGSGVTKEIGQDFKDLGAKNIAVFADPNLYNRKGYSAVNVVLQSLEDAKLKYKVFHEIGIEPTDSSFKKAIAFASSEHFDAYAAVGGGSTIDTAKAANLYATHPTEDFLDYVNPPIGKGKIPPGPVRPLIAVPTTAGTGSETTGVAIFDYEAKNFKTGIAHRILRPTLGIIDPLNTSTMPPNVAAASGFDVLCHALESYTAIPYNRRSPRPPTPLQRPAYQGSNPISDFWSLKALEMTGKYIVRAFRDASDTEARAQMVLAATFAGIGFGNGGVHLCHGMSYPVSGLAHSRLNFKMKDYPKEGSLIPHGISVILHAPAVFRFTASADPDRHRFCAKVLNSKAAEKARDEDVGEVLADALLPIMKELGVPDGLRSIGYRDEDIKDLVEGTIPQHRVTKLSPKPVGRDELTALFKDSMTLYSS